MRWWQTQSTRNSGGEAEDQSIACQQTLEVLPGKSHWHRAFASSTAHRFGLDRALAAPQARCGQSAYRRLIFLWAWSLRAEKPPCVVPRRRLLNSSSDERLNLSCNHDMISLLGNYCLSVRWFSGLNTAKEPYSLTHRASQLRCVDRNQIAA